MQLSKIMIGQVILVLVASGFLLFLSEGITTYPDIIGSYDNSSLVRIQGASARLDNITRDVNEDLQETSGPSGGVSDFLGFFFSAGYKAGIAAITAVELNNILIDEFINNTIGGTAYGEILKAGLGMMVIIVIIAILLHFITKSERA
jgi:hypothetical protein